MVLMRWTVVVPVKRLALAKTRLHTAGRDDRDHRALALALAVDTVGAALTCPTVDRAVVVTDDDQAGQALRPLGAAVVADEPDAGLNPALVHGATHATRLAPGNGVAVLSADLPALRPAELAEALRVAAGYPRSFLPDAAGTGTTLLTAGPGVALDPHYGPDSRTAHRRSGAVELAGDWPSLRRDVDTPADLAEAATLGLGRATRTLVVRTRQGTVRDFDPTTGAGSVLLDDGRGVPFDGSAFAASGLRLLRFGQRVRLETVGDRVVLVTIHTFG